MRKLNEKKHLLLSRKEDAQLEDHIAEYIKENALDIKNSFIEEESYLNFKFVKNRYKCVKLKNFIPSYLNTYNWLENDYEIHIIHTEIYNDVLGDCVFNENNIINKFNNLIIKIELNLNNFDVNELSGVLHHEFLHAYEVYNKIKNRKYRAYQHYDDFHIRLDNNFNTIIDTLYLVSPEERRARLQNFYHEIKGKTLKDSKTYNDYMFNYNVIDFIVNNIDYLDKDLFINTYGNIVEEIIGIKKTSMKYFEKISKYIKRWTDDTIKRMKDIDDYINNSKSDELIEGAIYRKRRFDNKNWMVFERGIRNRKFEEFN